MTLTEPTEEALERIADALWHLHGQAGIANGVTFQDIYEHNAANHTASGTIDLDGAAYGFIVEMGDRNGTVVLAWGDPEDTGTYDPGPPPEPLTFIPRNKQMSTTYAQWRKQDWFKEKVKAYLYDRHFQPGGFIEDYYRTFAASHGMIIGRLSEVKP